MEAQPRDLITNQQTPQYALKYLKTSQRQTMELLTPKQVGQILNLSQSTLTKMRSDKYKDRFNFVLPFIKIGRAVRYEREAINQAVSELKAVK